MEVIVVNAAGYQRSQMLKMILIMIVPTTSLIVLTLVAMVTSLRDMNSTLEVNEHMMHVLHMVDMNTFIREERGRSSMFISVSGLSLVGNNTTASVTYRKNRMYEARRQMELARTQLDEELMSLAHDIHISIEGTLFTTPSQVCTVVHFVIEVCAC